MINESIAHIVCACGQVFQVLLDDTWDEAATAAEYHQHVAECEESQ